MQSQRSTVFTTKSTVSVSAATSSQILKRNNKGTFHINYKKPGFLNKHIFPDNKRIIVANSEKGVPAQRWPYMIYKKGTNYTPRPLLDISFPSHTPDKLITGLPTAKPLAMTTSQSLSSMHSFTSRYSLSRRSRASQTASLISGGVISVAEFSWTSMAQRSEGEEEMEIKDEDRAPSLFRLREDPPPREAIVDTNFTINLVETETMFMLELPTIADSVESEQGKEFAELNVEYEKKMRTGRTLSHVSTQTTRYFNKHRKLHMPRNQRANSAAWATVWDIYDTYEEQIRESIKSAVIREEGKVDFIQTSQEDNYDREFEFEYMGHKFKNQFLNALMIMERFLEKNVYKENQLLFQGLLVQSPLSIDVKYNYSLKLLWSFKSEHTKLRIVTSMEWSTKNQNLLAVGYGKFRYTDKCDGLVCIWNVKSPQHPERQYQFEDPVTFVTWSPFRTHILAVSFYSGLLLLMDIVSRTVMIKATNQHYPLFDPVWQVQWYPSEIDKPGQCLITCGGNGRIYKYKKTKFFVSKKIMSMGRPHGNIQGVEQPKKCYARKTLSCLHPSAEVLVLHPSDPMMYLVGTREGCVYICSVNHRHDHIDVFVAHDGPVYNIQFNPFCNKVFLTCGADWCIRIWAEGIFEPLITLSSGMTAVQSALWSPLHATIIISITGTFIEIWDIRRRTSTPKSSTQSPSKSLNTVIRFSENKFNICVGDGDGNVHVMALTEMPFSPGFQAEVLAQSIQNVLITKPDLSEKLRKLGYPFSSKESNFKTKMYRKLGNLQKNI